ncbi:MAG TPA: hypothetical protein VI300_17850, partial [Solirubrobacter sp.]
MTATAAVDRARLVSAAPALAATAAVVVTLLFGGIGAPTLLLFAGSQLVFVLAPGIAVYRALSSEPGGHLRQLTFGWVTGEALLIATYIVAGMLGLRGVFWLFPIAVLVAALPAALRAESGDEAGPSRGQAWALAGIVTVVVVAAAAAVFPNLPLPQALGAAGNWDQDPVFFLSIAGEAKWHWPLVDANVAGLPFQYHYLAYVDMGAKSRLTGIELTDLMLRIDVVVPQLLAGLLLALAGRVFTGRWSVGVLAALFVLLVGELDIDPTIDWTFQGRGASLERDTAFHYAVVFGLGALILIAERLGLTDRERAPGRGEWFLLALLVAAAGGSKAPMIAVLIGGVGVLLALDLVVRRHWPDRRGWTLIAVLAPVLVGVAVLVVPRQSESKGLSRQFGAVFDKMALIRDAGLHPAQQLPGVLAWPLGAVIGLLAVVPVVTLGVILAARYGDGLDGRLRTLLFGVFAVGVLGTVATVQSGNSEEYFIWCGYPAAALAAAAAFDQLARVRLASSRARWTFAAGLAASVALCLLIALAFGAVPLPRPHGLGWLPPALADNPSSIGLFAVVLIASAIACVAAAPAGRAEGSGVGWKGATFALLGLLAVFVVASADRIVPWALETVTGNPYGAIHQQHIRIAFVLWVGGAGCVLGAASWFAAGRMSVARARAALLVVAALSLVLAPASNARVPFAGVLAVLAPLALIPVVALLAVLGAPA